MTNPINPSSTGTHIPSRTSSRLILVTKAFPQSSETFIVRKFLGLLDQGWDIHVVSDHSASKEWKHFPQLANRKGLSRRVHVSWPMHSRFLRILLFPLAFLRCFFLAPTATLQYLKKGWKRFGPFVLDLLYRDAEFIILKPAIIHYEFGTLARGHLHLKDFLNCRISVGFRGADISYMGVDQPGFYQEVWEKADVLLLMGEAQWDQALKRGCPPDKPHDVIYPSVDTSFFSPSQIDCPEITPEPARPYRILSIGRLVWKKGYEYDLQAIKWLVDQGIPCEYHIMGDGFEREAVEFTRRDLGLENVVSLLGQQPQSEEKRQLEWADVYLHAAISEGFCLSILEAQSMARPVVCADAGNLSIINGETGYILPRRDWRGLAEKLALLAQNPAMRQRMGAAARQSILNKYQWSTEISHFDQFYRKLLS